MLGKIGELFPILFPIRLGMVSAFAFGIIFGAVIVLERVLSQNSIP
jgi:hypothetical protein